MLKGSELSVFKTLSPMFIAARELESLIHGFPGQFFPAKGPQMKIEATRQQASKGSQDHSTRHFQTVESAETVFNV